MPHHGILMDQQLGALMLLEISHQRLDISDTSISTLVYGKNLALFCQDICCA